MTYCFAFSEPEHGSDLGAIETYALTSGESCTVTGHKTWVAGADTATHAVVLCRIGASVSTVRVPLAQNSVEVRPIVDLTGAARLFDLFLDGASGTACSLAAQTGEVEYEAEFWALVQTARECGRALDPLVRQHLAWAYAQVHILHTLPHSPVRQVLAAEYHRRLGEIAIDAVGPEALLRAGGEGYMLSQWQKVFLDSRGDTLAQGTTELLRTRIAETMLELP